MELECNLKFSQRKISTILKNREKMWCLFSKYMILIYMYINTTEVQERIFVIGRGIPLCVFFIYDRNLTILLIFWNSFFIISIIQYTYNINLRMQFSAYVYIYTLSIFLLFSIIICWKIFENLKKPEMIIYFTFS